MNDKKKIEKISWDASAIEKNGYDDFMLKEINEQVVFNGEQVIIDNSDKVEYESVCGKCYLKLKNVSRET